MKNYLKVSALTLLTGMAILSCQKEKVEIKKKESASTEKMIKITHHYQYKGESYDVFTFFNSKNEILKQTGEFKKHNEVTTIDRNGESIAYLVDKVSEDGKEFHMRIFDSELELNKNYENQEVYTKAQTRCTDWLSQPGTARFYFFEDPDYISEFNNIRVTNASYFQDQWLDNANNSISSLWIGPTWTTTANENRLDVFQGSCFSGSIFSLTSSVPNLHWMSTNLGNNISSLKGWSLN